MLNNIKSKFSFNEMNKKDLPAMYSSVFWCLLFYCFLALLRNHCYYLHKKKFADLSITFLIQGLLFSTVACNMTSRRVHASPMVCRLLYTLSS